MQFLDLAGVKRIKQYIDDSIVNFITNSVSNLTNYYLKSETYTKSEVEALIAAINQFHYETAASTSAVSSPANNVLYLIGPTGTGEDKYEEYVYSNSNWVKIGDTSISLSGYVTTQMLNTALADYTNTTTLNTLLAGKQDTIADLSDIRTGSQNNVKYISQSLTDTQKEQARTNIGAGTYSKPSTGIPASDLADGVVPGDFIVNITVNDTVTPWTYSTSTKASELTAAYSAGKRLIAHLRFSSIASSSSAFNSIYEKVILTAVSSLDDEGPSAFHATFNTDYATSYLSAIDNAYLNYVVFQLTLRKSSNDGLAVTLVRPDLTPTSNSDKLITSGGVYTALSGKYTKPSTGIPASDLASGVIPSSPGTLTTTSTTALSTASSEVLSGNISLHKVAKTGTYSDLVGLPTVDSNPTENSTNLVSSGGVHQYITNTLGNAKIFYGTCDTAAATTAKVVTCTDFTSENLVKGALIYVTFAYTNSGAVADITLNVNGTGAKSIKKETSTSSGGSTANLQVASQLQANNTYLFQYNGTYWVCMTMDHNTNTTYSSMTVAEIDAGTGTTARLITPARLKHAVETWAPEPEGDFIVPITSAYDSQSDSVVFSTTTTYTELSSAYTTGKRIIASISGEDWSGDVVMTYVWPTDGEDSSYFTAIFTDVDACYPEAIFLTKGSNDEIVVIINYPDHELKPFSSNVVTNGAIYYGIHPIVATAIVSAQNITPNRYHRFGTITGNITFALATPSDSSIMNHYYWTFVAGSTAPTITWPSGISWFGGSAPTITAGKHYDVSILDNIAVCMEV